MIGLCLDFHPPEGSSYCLHCGARELTHEIRAMAAYEYAKTVQVLLKASKAEKEYLAPCQ